MIVDIKKAKRAALEAELDLYREAGTQGVAETATLTNVEKLKTEIERLQKEVGYPVKLDKEFIDEPGNKVLVDYLMENGAQEGEIVFAEEADMEEVAKIEAELEARNTALSDLKVAGVVLEVDPDTLSLQELHDRLDTVTTQNTEAEKKSGTGLGAQISGTGLGAQISGTGLGAQISGSSANVAPDLVYQGKTVVNVTNTLVHGKAHKDVYVSTGECFRMTPEAFIQDVKPRQ